MEFQKQPNSNQGNQVQSQSHLVKEKPVNKFEPFRITGSITEADSKVQWGPPKERVINQTDRD